MRPRKSAIRRRKTAARQASVNADDLELSALRDGFAPLQSGLDDDRLADPSLEEFETPIESGAEPFLAQDIKLEDAVVPQNNVISQREAMLKSLYPFKIERNTLVYYQSSTLAYEYLLAVSKAPSLSAEKFAEIPRSFERFVGQAIVAFLGPGAESYRLGWPPDPPHSPLLRERVKEISNRTGEWRWNPLPEHTNHQGPRSVKDGGIDLVIWKQFGDQRISSLYLLGQCACGNDWTTKRSDLKPHSFKDKWLHMLSHSGQLKFMAIPFHVPDENLWTESCHWEQAGIFVDRLRLTLLAEHSSFRPHWQENPRDLLLPLIRLVVPKFEAK